MKKILNSLELSLFLMKIWELVTEDEFRSIQDKIQVMRAEDAQKEKGGE